MIPTAITAFVEASVSITRLQSFLTNEELQRDSVQRKSKVTKKGEVAVNVGADATFLWQRKPEYKVALKNINFAAKKGKLTCVVGKVGSGKSALIQAILGDLFRVKGFASVHGSIAYVSQVPWIMNGTVKDNILFGHKYDESFYTMTLKACALIVDLAVLPKGDQTLVGEKGISLSGGQKARLSQSKAFETLNRRLNSLNIWTSQSYVMNNYIRQRENSNFCDSNSDISQRSVSQSKLHFQELINHFKAVSEEDEYSSDMIRLDHGANNKSLLLGSFLDGIDEDKQEIVTPISPMNEAINEEMESPNDSSSVILKDSGSLPFNRNVSDKLKK